MMDSAGVPNGWYGLDFRGQTGAVNRAYMRSGGAGM